MLEGIGRRPNSEAQFLDIGQHTLSGYEPNVLFRNGGDGRFTEVGFVNGVDTTHDGRGLAVLDYDQDGRLDLVLRNYRQPAQLFRNQGPKRHWVGFELTGTTSNRDAVGARVRIRTSAKSQTRVVAAGGGYLSATSKRLHFGLGPATRVDEVEISWPSGQRTLLRDLDADRSYRITEAPVLGRR